MALEKFEPAEPLTKTEWTCPMHPEIIKDSPGNCPICGMALEQKTISIEEEKNPELIDMTRRFWIGLALALPLVFIEMGKHIPGMTQNSLLGSPMLKWLQLILATPVVLWGGWSFFGRGVQSIVNRGPNMFTLIALGVSVAYGYSLVTVFAPGIFPASFRGRGGEVAAYFEAAAVITVLVLLGQVLELQARSRTGAAIKALLGLVPRQARIIRDDEPKKMSRSHRCSPETNFGFVLVRKFRWTALP